MFLDCLSQERVDGEVVPLQAPWQGQWGETHSHIKWFNPQDSLAERYCEAKLGLPARERAAQTGKETHAQVSLM